MLRSEDEDAHVVAWEETENTEMARARVAHKKRAWAKANPERVRATQRKSDALHPKPYTPVRKHCIVCGSASHSFKNCSVVS